MTTTGETPSERTSGALRPTDLASLRDAVLDTPGPVTVVGAGTAWSWGAAADPAATVLGTGGLHGVITHNPGDMTVSVRAGTPLAAVQAELAPHGQRIALDPPRAVRGATVGGLFATADAGPLALSYGTMRDLVIGATVVLADGTVARSGGHVIKNVAGYDLAKLLHGSFGTLAVVAELVLRCHPSPATTATLTLPCTLEDLAVTAAGVGGHPVEVSALEWAPDPDAPGTGRLLARLEGTADGVRGRVARLHDELGGEELGTAQAEQAWDAHAALVDARPDDGAVLRLGVAPTRLPGVLTQLVDAGARGVTASPATGVATVTLPADAAAVRGAHDLVATAGGTTTLRHRPAGPAGADLPAWGPAPSSVALLRAVAASLDPDQRIGRGRLAPWLPATPDTRPDTRDPDTRTTDARTGVTA